MEDSLLQLPLLLLLLLLLLLPAIVQINITYVLELQGLVKILKSKGPETKLLFGEDKTGTPLVYNN